MISVSIFRFEGEFCEFEIDWCDVDNSPHKCDFGTCNSTFAHNYTCICDSGYQGVFCSDDLNECLEPEGLTYCQNNGTCINGVNTKTCDCTGIGWEGTQCGTMVNDCILPMGQLGTPCENGGNCTDAFNDYVCDCVTGWIGDECQADINECAIADPLGDFNPCENGGICLDQVGSYECDCFNTGYEGDLCTDDVDECLLLPCQNGGSCTNLNGTFNCTCQDGYSGPTCGEVDDICPHVTCFNGGTCEQTSPTEHHCNCIAGYRGDNCELESCNGQCLLGSTCTEVISGITCACAPNTEGSRCESYTCDPDPCVNGVCGIDTEIFCQCPYGFDGPHCETEFAFRTAENSTDAPTIDFDRGVFTVDMSLAIAASSDTEYTDKVTNTNTNRDSEDITIYVFFGLNLFIISFSLLFLRYYSNSGRPNNSKFQPVPLF